MLSINGFNDVWPKDYYDQQLLISENMNTKQQEIIDYYVLCENAYVDAWGLRRNRQLNLGLWYEETKSLGEAMHNLNKKIAKLAGMNNTCTLLDAGCGVGGTTIFLAKEFGSIVHGIGIVPQQIEQCKENAAREGVGDKAHYQVMDYCQTNYPDAFFDVVIGIESICHADSKAEFLKEAHRILKPGGRLVIADPLQAKDNLSAKEQKTLYDDSFHGCAVFELWTADQYLTELEKLGYQTFEHTEYTDQIRPSIKRLRRFYYPAWIYNHYRALIGKPFGKTEIANTRMCYYMLTALDQHLWSYSFFRAIK